MGIGRMVLVLTLVCLISAISLVVVDSITREPIRIQEKLFRLKAVKAVLPGYDNDPDEDKKNIAGVDFYIGKKGAEIVGFAFEVREKEGYGGTISVMLGVTPKGEITGIEIIDHKETPGLGAKITEYELFRRQFENKSLLNSKIKVIKDRGDIEAITGATISSRAVCKAVSKGLELFAKVKDSLL
ncbi:MAG: RnfABCDGE type electron transport complex subunit G [bacterium]|nr:RnfABCDGE type electron transport complex subunit G [bacterium]